MLVLLPFPGPASICSSRLINASIYVLFLVSTLIHCIRASQTPLLREVLIKNYTRIRIKSNEDLVKGYSLLLQHIDKPSLAHSVKEFVFDKPPQVASSGFFRPPPTDDEAPQLHEILNDSEYTREERKIIGALDRLGLSNGLEISPGKERAHTAAVQAIKKWRNAHIAQVGSMEGGPSAWQKHWSNDKTVNSAFAQILAPLLISFSPNIEKLKFTLLSATAQDFFLQISYGLLPPTCLQNLKQVAFGPSKNGSFWQYDTRFFSKYDVIGMARLVHKLPLLESISVGGTEGDQNGLGLQPPGVSSLKCLHIGHSNISSLYLSNLIRMSKALEHFCVSVGGRAANSDGFSTIHPKTIAKSLFIHREVLRTLDVDVDSYLFDRYTGEDREYEDGLDILGDRDGNLKYSRKDPYFRIDEAEAQALGIPIFPKDLPNTRKYGSTIGSLHDFSALTHLSIGVKLLLGVEKYNSTTRQYAVPPSPFRLINALPSNLEYLCIRGYKKGESEEWDGQVTELMALRAERPPLLQTIIGIDEEIVGGEVVEDLDHNKELLWKEPGAEEDLWEEWSAIKTFWDDVDDED
jgi:hypothetical protein